MKNLFNKYRSLPIQAKASFWFLVCAVIQKGIASITTPIFIRIMSTDDYGRFGVFNSWLGIISVFVTLNLSFGVFSQGLVKFREERFKFASSMEGLSFTLFLLYTIAYLLFHDFFNQLFKLTTVQMLSMLILAWTGTVYNLWAEEQRVEFKYRPIIAISLILSFVEPALSIFLITHSDDKVTARILGIVLVNLLCCSSLFVIQIRKGKTFFSKKYWVYALCFNAPLIPHYLSSTVLSSADRIMIENMTNSTNAGIYNLAYSLSLIMTIFNTALMQTLSPWIYMKIRDKKIKDIESIAYKTLILIGTLNIIFILFAPEIVTVFGTKEYAEAIWIIPPVAMSVFFIYCYDLFAKFAFYHEKTIFVMVASVLGAALNILLNYLLIPVFGYIAAGYTTLICYMVYSFVHYLFMRNVCKKCCDGIIPYKTGTLLKITSVFLLLGFLFAFTYINSLIRYGLMVIILILCFFFRKKLKSELVSILSIKKTDKRQ